MNNAIALSSPSSSIEILPSSSSLLSSSLLASSLLSSSILSSSLLSSSLLSSSILSSSLLSSSLLSSSILSSSPTYHTHDTSFPTSSFLLSPSPPIVTSHAPTSSTVSPPISPNTLACKHIINNPLYTKFVHRFCWTCCTNSASANCIDGHHCHNKFNKVHIM